LADQNLNGESAIFTRQSNNANRHGYECPEERDYCNAELNLDPYWYSSPWRDIWVCTDTPAMCPYYRDNSQNVLNKGSCSDPALASQASCEANGSKWIVDGSWNQPPPECGICPATNNNHLGQTIGNTFSNRRRKNGTYIQMENSL
jgi:hypothetical protein